MAKRKNNGINLITIIFILAIIIIAGAFTKNIIQKNNEQENNNTVIEEVEQEKYVQILEDGTKLNISSKLKENKKLDDLELKDIQLTYKNGVTNLLCNIQNSSDTKSEIQNVEIVLLDENENVMYKLQGVIDEIEVGEIVQFNTSITADYANVYDFEINKK